jgi:ubiquinone/menaquinone biosynthesis C-methylase UbiE
VRQLEIGPGRERLPGFETLNVIRTPTTDHVGDARKLPFPDGAFDLVYSSHCIEHLEWFDIEAAVREWSRILKPGGTLEIFTVDALALMRGLVVLEDTGEWTGPKVGAWRQGLTKGDPYLWAVGRLMNYPKNAQEFHRALITPGYLRRCMEGAGIRDIVGLTEERGHRHGPISFGLRGVKS